MVNQTEEKIIEALLVAGHGQEYVCALNDRWKVAGNMTVSSLSKKLKISESRIQGAVRELEKQGYIAYRYSELDFSKPYPIAFVLTNKGLSYREERQRREEEEKQRNQESADWHTIATTIKEEADGAKEEAKAAKFRAWLSIAISVVGLLIALAALIVDHLPPTA